MGRAVPVHKSGSKQPLLQRTVRPHVEEALSVVRHVEILA